MAQRIDRFTQQRTATRNLLEWLGVAAVSTLAALALTCNVQAAEPDAPHIGQMLRPSVELADIAELPADGWYRVTDKVGALLVQAVAAPVSVPGEEEAEAIDTRYIRVPGARIAEGRLPAISDAGGVLAPGQGDCYQFELDGVPFALTVRNGLVYTVRMDEEFYSFHLEGGMSSDSQVLTVVDLDSDGKPDFIVRVGDREMLLLSSLANPGLNPPAAVLALHADGC